VGSLSHFLYLKRHIEILPCCSNEGHFVVTCVQQKLAGVSRGCGWQHLAAWTNLVAFYIVGLPLSILFGFKLGLQTKVLFLKLCIYDICNVYPMQIRKKKSKFDAFPTNPSYHCLPQGLWLGQICGLLLQNAVLLFITLRTKWERLELTMNGKEDGFVC
jgi:MATE family multidrug resistance protein